jgi:hypothetical protein
MKKKLNQQGFHHLLMAALIVVVVAAVGFAGWYVWDKNKTDDSANTTNPTPTPTVSVTPTQTVLPSNIVEYTTAEVGQQYGGMTLTELSPFLSSSEISENNFKMIFTGDIDIEGTFSYANSDFFGEYILNFTVDENQLNFPTVTTNENRTFSIPTTAEALRDFGIIEGQDKVGGANITISKYTYFWAPTEGLNLVELVAVNNLR